MPDLDAAYLLPAPNGGEIAHGYGPRVHVLADPWSLSLLARFAAPDCGIDEVHRLLDAAYARLFAAAVRELPMAVSDAPTRMAAAVGARGTYRGVVIDRASRAVIVDVARAGMLPAHQLQRALHLVLPADHTRVDHLYFQRVADPITGRVTGVSASGSKIGGDVDGVTMFVPDPMGATGASLVQALAHYEDNVAGRPSKRVSVHLVVTPEFLAHVTKACPDLAVYCLRVDRGMSAPDVLETPLGARWSEERGLSDNDYIVPGAGGVGELISNSFV